LVQRHQETNNAGGGENFRLQFESIFDTMKSPELPRPSFLIFMVLLIKKCHITNTKRYKKARNCSKLSDIQFDMTVLEIIAEQRLGIKNLTRHPRLRLALQRVDDLARRNDKDEDGKTRVASIVELCFAYDRETDVEEKANILRTLDEISSNEVLELPAETVEEWEGRLTKDPEFSKAKDKLNYRHQKFQRKYFSLRARAGLQTQEAVAKKAGLRRSYVAVIESGLHFPQQKTLQKLAKAFDVDVTELL
jgi:DNA-binding XRE family transcriptional regulator